MNKELLKKLQEPFSPEDIEWRVQTSGIKESGVWALVFCYVTSRAVMNRLDDVLGVTGWHDEYRLWHDAEVKKHGKVITLKSQICGISIWDDEKKIFITKWDGAEDTDKEPIKGGISDSFKRAAVKFGIGRYLYKTDSGFATIAENGKYRDTAKSKDGSQKKTYRWDPPQLPNWALPEKDRINEESVIDDEADKIKLFEKTRGLLKKIGYNPQRIKDFMDKQKTREVNDIKQSVKDIEEIAKKLKDKVKDINKQKKEEK